MSAQTATKALSPPLRTFDEQGTRQHIAQCVGAYDRSPVLAFSERAIQRIHELAQGQPEVVARLCVHSLALARTCHQPRVERVEVEKAALELFEIDPPALGAPPEAAWGSSPPWSTALITGGLSIGLGALLWASSHLVPALLKERQASASAEILTTATDQTPQATEVVPPQNKTVSPIPSSVPAKGPPAAAELFREEAEAWRELGLWWEQTLPSTDPCAAAAQAGLRCYRSTHISMEGLRQLDRPGIVTLRTTERASGLALLTHIAADNAILQVGTRRWEIPLAAFVRTWQGDFATLWRAPPGHQSRPTDGRPGPTAAWLSERITDLQAAGRVPPSAPTLTARIKAFQRAHGIEAGGVAGPITFMQINMASDVKEPRLFGPHS